MKVIAMYLPQFHRIPENDQWWGEGYTEWNAVKNAEKFYEEHYQPHIPLNNNYYNLLEKDTMKWQVKLMKNYQVYGMCFYHYYFENGKKILEQPAENLLKWKDIEMPFCFSWANETWARTWSYVQGRNSWNQLLEGKYNSEDNGILLRQDYGEEEEWEKHFNYLLPFFRDNRYIKIDKKPVFIIYKPDDIPCVLRMMEKWKELAKKNGMDGIYFIATNSDINGFDAYLMQEPNYSCNGYEKAIEDYEIVCNRLINNIALADKKHFFCGFPGYDDTPRRGKNGRVIINGTPSKFYKLMKGIFYFSDKKGSEYAFVNAWNEWGEGMYLEPDEKEQYNYLEALKKALLDYKEISEQEEKEFNKILYIDKRKEIDQKQLKKYIYFIRLFDKWLYVKENHKTIQFYFNKKGYQRIVIYGLGMTGKHLLAELKELSVEIAYGIDKRNDMIMLPFPVYSPEETLPKADVIIVSVTYDFDSIYKNLKNKFNGPIISLEEVIDYVIKRIS